MTFRLPRSAVSLSERTSRSIADLLNGADPPGVIQRYLTAALAAKPEELPQVRRFALFLEATARASEAQALVRSAFEHHRSLAMLRWLHQLFGLADDRLAQHEIELEYAAAAPADPVVKELAIERLSAVGQYRAAAALWHDHVRLHEPTRVMVAAHAANLRRLHQFDELIALTPTIDAHLDVVSAATYAFDAHWAVGNEAHARDRLAAASQQHPFHVRMVDRAAWMVADQCTVDLDVGERVAMARAVAPADAVGVAQAALTLEHHARAEDTLSFLRRAETAASLRPIASLAYARTLYRERDFEAALAQCRTLLGTARHREASGLIGRIHFELGDNEAAAAVRRANPAPRSQLDQLSNAVALGAGRLDEAFTSSAFPADLRDLAFYFEAAQPFPQCNGGRLGILLEAGPGDQLLHISLLHAIEQHYGELVIAADHRLVGLLQTALPSASIVGSERLTRPELGTFRHGHPRAPGPFADRLSSDASALLQTCDEVVLGRSLRSAIRPAEYQALPKVIAAPASPQTTRTNPTVGLVWRSEKSSAWRDIHYVDPVDLTPLLQLDATFVILQHDCTALERVTVTELAASEVTFPSTIDLRNDFERTAELLNGLDAVVGPNTTMTALSGALGVPTVVLQPTRFGEWQTQRKAGYWFPSQVHQTADPPWDRRQLGQNAADRLRDMLF